MGKTYRKQHLSKISKPFAVITKHRDGVAQHSAKSCDNHGGCPKCEGDRTFAEKRQKSEACEY